MSEYQQYVPEHRRTGYKNRGQFKVDELRRRREEAQVEIRRKKREEDLARRRASGELKEQEIFDEDPNAGTNVTVHKDAAWKQSWQNFRDSSPMMQRVFGLKSVYNESENPLISTARSISDRVAGFFAENETAQVIKKFREMDPHFQLEPFLTEMRTYILPEVLEAYVKGDVEVLKTWLSAAQFQVYSALMHQYTTAGLQSDGRILDIRNVDILSARMLDPGDIPVFVLMCRTQEVHVYKNKKTGILAAGMVFFPLVNPDGVAYDQSSGSLWRKNRNTKSGSSGSSIGVDLNRNFDFLWNFRKYFDSGEAPASTSPSSETFYGTAAASEPETKNHVSIYDSFPKVSSKRTFLCAVLTLFRFVGSWIFTPPLATSCTHGEMTTTRPQPRQ